MHSQQPHQLRPEALLFCAIASYCNQYLLLRAVGLPLACTFSAPQGMSRGAVFLIIRRLAAVLICT